MRRIMHRNGLRESAYAAQLDVDDLAGLHLDGGERVSSISNRLVKTDRRIEPLLQHGVVIEVVVPEGLLDHQQVERIKGHQVIGIAQLVGRVGVHAERNLGPAVAHPLKNIHIPARLALELDALALNDGEQLGNRVLNAQRHAAGDGLSHAADQI